MSYLFPFMGHSPVVVKATVLLSETMSYAVQGHLRWTGHSEKLRKGAPLDEETATHSSIPAWEITWT